MFYRHLYLNLKHFFLVLSVVIAAVTQLWAQATDKELLPPQLTEQWKAASPVTTLNAKDAATLPSAALYAEHGLRKIQTRSYSNAVANYKVELFDLGFAANAYGLYTLKQSSLSERESFLHQGQYLVRISGLKTGAAIDQAFLNALKQKLSGSTDDLPILPSKLPTGGKLTNSERYVIGPAGLETLTGLVKFKEAINFKGGVEIAAAEYQNGTGLLSLTIIEYYTPQLASDGYTQIENTFTQLPHTQQATTLIKRTGNYAIVATNVTDRLAVQALIDQIKYAPKVYWEARKLSDLPAAYRPPDPAVLEEAAQTANVIIRTFYWIGIMLVSALLLGVTSGAIFFYWNRWRKRRLGIEDIFSDAGGTVRLNLDNYLLAPESKKQNLMGGGKQED